MGAIEVKYKITYGLSINSMTFDLGWAWTILDLDHETFSWNTSNTKTDTMLDTMEVR